MEGAEGREEGRGSRVEAPDGSHPTWGMGSEGCFFGFLQKSVLAALYSSEGSVMEVPPLCLAHPVPHSLGWGA